MNDQSERYNWLKNKEDIDDLLASLFRAEEDEDVDLYLLRIHLDQQDDLSIFSPDTLAQIRTLMAELIKDTEKHSDMIKMMIETLEKDGK